MQARRGSEFQAAEHVSNRFRWYGVRGLFMKCLLLTSDWFYARLGDVRFFEWNLTHRKRTLDE